VALWKGSQAEWTEAKPLISRGVGGGGCGADRTDGNGFRVPFRLKNTNHITSLHSTSQWGQINSRSHTFRISSFRMPDVAQKIQAYL